MSAAAGAGRALLVCCLLALPVAAQESRAGSRPGPRERVTARTLSALGNLARSNERPTAPSRRRAAVRRIIGSWYAALEDGEPGRRPRTGDAARGLRVLRAWLALEPARRVRECLVRSHPRFAALLGHVRDVDARRAFLAAVADQGARDPGHSDLDVLCEVVAWEALLLALHASGRPRLDALTRDLVLLFTERGPGGLALSRSPHYRRGRFRDRGFHPDLRDGGDQVRHFCWALRMFTDSRAPALTERMLHLKEERDARARKQPLNRADLRLNAAARRLARTLAPAPEPRAEEAASRPSQTAPAPRDWPRLLRAALGPPQPVSPRNDR